MEANEVETVDAITEIYKELGVWSEEEVLLEVRMLKGEVERLRNLFSSIVVVPVVLVGGQPLFAQMPPIIPQREYPVEVLEMVRDGLVDASTSFRSPIAYLKAKGLPSVTG